jgi:putative membrane protein
MTERLRIALVLPALLLCLSACQPDAPTGSTAHGAGQAQEPAVFSKVDASFINTAGPLVIEETRFAQLAATKAADPAIRRFAAAILADRGTVNQQLASLAAANGLAPTSEMAGSHPQLYEKLQALNGVAFDRAYIGGELQQLTMVIQAFQRESDSGSKPEVRDVARQHLALMQEQLQTASAMAGL